MAKRFFYACAGLLMLALSYYFGASTVSAQSPSNPIVGLGGSSGYLAVAANGDVYNSNNGGGVWNYMGNVFGQVSPTQVRTETWGEVKARYR